MIANNDDSHSTASPKRHIDRISNMYEMKIVANANIWVAVLHFAKIDVVNILLPFRAEPRRLETITSRHTVTATGINVF